jgi:MFS family permease
VSATLTLPTSPAGSAPGSADLGGGWRGSILAIVCLSLALVVAGVAMLNVAMATMTRALGASQTDQQWIIDSYTVALAALLLFAGALGDRFGRRRALVGGLALFVAANAFSAFANSAGALIVWRFLAGVGAALIMPATLSTITSVFPPDKRAKAVGLWAGIAGAGGMLGLLVAGAMLEQWWWGSIFVVTAVLGAVALVATVVLVPETRATHTAGLDPPGALLSIAAAGGLVFGIIEGPSRGWTDPITLFGLLGGALAGVLFVCWELRSPAPLLDPRRDVAAGHRRGHAGRAIRATDRRGRGSARRRGRLRGSRLDDGWQWVRTVRRRLGGDRRRRLAGDDAGDQRHHRFAAPSQTGRRLGGQRHRT